MGKHANAHDVMSACEVIFLLKYDARLNGTQILAVISNDRARVYAAL